MFEITITGTFTVKISKLETNRETINNLIEQLDENKSNKHRFKQNL